MKLWISSGDDFLCHWVKNFTSQASKFNWKFNSGLLNSSLKPNVWLVPSTVFLKIYSCKNYYYHSDMVNADVVKSALSQRLSVC